MKLDEIVAHMDNYNFTKFHQNQMKNKKVLLIARFSAQNFKVSVELWKSYIVCVIRDYCVLTIAENGRNCKQEHHQCHGIDQKEKVNNAPIRKFNNASFAGFPFNRNN